MHKGISFYFGYDLDVKEKAKMLTNVGFDSVITSADPKFVHQNGSISQQAKLFKKVGLRASSLHMRYNKEELSHFFVDDKIGRKIEKNLIKDVKIAKKYGFKCVVVHLQGNISFVGVERFKRILKVCEKTKIPLALENLRDLRPLCYFLDNFKGPYVKFCYDSGHHNVYNKKVDLLKKYGNRLICVHLHDNDGTRDVHGLNRFGTIDWQELAIKLAKTNLKYLDYELIPKDTKGLTAQETLEECKKQADELEKLILQERRAVKGKGKSSKKTIKKKSKKNKKKTSKEKKLQEKPTEGKEENLVEAAKVEEAAETSDMLSQEEVVEANKNESIEEREEKNDEETVLD